MADRTPRRREQNDRNSAESWLYRRKLVRGAGMRVSAPILFPVGANTVSYARAIGCRIPRTYRSTGQ